MYHLTCLMYRCIVTYLPLGNFTTLKIMNLASNCRYPNQYDWIDLCLPWNESQQPILPRSLTLLADAASYQAYCRWYMFVFQQENAPSHHAKDTIKLLQQEVLDFIGPDLWPPNSLDLNPVDYKVCGVMQQRVYETMNVVWTVLMSWSSTLLKSGIVCSRTLLTRHQLVEKATKSNKKEHACVQVDNILNIYCERMWLAKVMNTWNIRNFVYSQNKMLLYCWGCDFQGLEVSQGKVRTTNRWGGILNHLSMGYLLSSIFTKNYWNRLTIVEIIVGSGRYPFFWDTV